ncbi:MAG: hypothetical protein ABGZ35_12660 [Planctomycetaceae bacterium]
MTAPKELVILAAQFDLVACRWSVASIDDQSVVDPLVQSLPDDLLNYRSGTFHERTSFLRHRIAGALQRGNDRLWGQQRKSELFAIEFATESVAVDGELIRRVAEHFCSWMVKPPVVCLQLELGTTLSMLASNADTPDQQRIAAGLTTMRPLTQQSDRWERPPVRKSEGRSS